MIKAVLLDLDDTLLGNPTQQFVENYLAALNQHFAETAQLSALEGPLMQATRAVFTERDPLRANVDRFYEALAPALTVPRAALEEAVTSFYQTAYRGLQRGTLLRPGARPLVEWLIAQNYTVVVATNPFFPREAVELRLIWAGLPVEEVTFRLVTHLENMHFTKPHPEYYEETLARIGVQADEAVMIGDDWHNDILPARGAGLNTFWIGDPAAPPPGVDPALADGAGSLDDFARLVREDGWLDALTPRPLVPAQIAPRLTGNLAALFGVAGEVPPEVWHMRPMPDEWTPIEVVCHLEESEWAVQRPRLETILREDNPFLRQPPPPPVPAARTCPPEGVQVVRVFAEERGRTLDLLAGLDDAAWARPARHSIFGPTTLLEMANFTAQHDRLHITQLCETVGKCL